MVLLEGILLGLIIVAAAIGGAVVFAAPSGPQTFVLVGEDGARACGTDPCAGLSCVLQGDPTPTCTCQQRLAPLRCPRPPTSRNLRGNQE